MRVRLRLGEVEAFHQMDLVAKRDLPTDQASFKAGTERSDAACCFTSQGVRSSTTTGRSSGRRSHSGRHCLNRYKIKRSLQKAVGDVAVSRDPGNDGPMDLAWAYDVGAVIPIR
ncbi:hypothetical protein PMAA_008260 [Talaromyces marneffei ATCC 18224]|uniref:Uncharacterized protein n=1 Tax=Talaromyces marneffei (strain ATCC 18224 / CBS 334.59 / QM 7333) TaxID=441960 RepID=B6QWG9_TALMQ|nr:hypothetical protein PMAA_008260 [Talaromyces marneffei ATCC 18224]